MNWQIPNDTRESTRSLFICHQHINMQLWIVINANEQSPLVILFWIRWGKKNCCIKVEEKNKKLTCLQAAAEPWRQHDKVNGAPLSRGRHTGVGKHSALRLMVQWCLWDKTEVSRTQYAVRGLLKLCQLSLYLTFPLLFTHEITEMDMVAWIRSDLTGCKSRSFALFQGLKHKRVLCVKAFC